jgi:alkanesulfonate monooxygenase SsuD/methylene tetrahydromethanopterin reductase-like flavin-dependent oxidoreductase (luciferase family)
MRFGLVLRGIDEEQPLPGLVAQAQAAEAAGFDLIWVDEDRSSEAIPPAGGAPVSDLPGRDPTGSSGAAADGATGSGGTGLPDALAVACALAPHTTTMSVGACCRAGVVHPAYLAEQSAVADLVLGGRLILGLRPAPGTEALLGEVVDLLGAAHASVPFQFEGAQWTMPGALEGNRFGVTEAVAVTPVPVQLELPVWLAGAAEAVTDVAATRAVGLVGDDSDGAALLADRWGVVARALGPAVRRLRRVARRAVPVGSGGGPDLDGLRERLADDQRRWRMDTVLLELPPGADLACTEELVTPVARQVRPPLAMAALPPGLVEHWQITGHHTAADGGSTDTTHPRSTNA